MWGVVLLGAGAAVAAMAGFGLLALSYRRQAAAFEARLEELENEAPPERRTVASEHTSGQYYCSREIGHTGPCAAWPAKGT